MEETTGVVRKIDKLGRVCLPIDLRREYGIMIDDSVEIIGKNDGILIRTYNPGCVFCNSTDGVEEHEGQMVCAFHREYFKCLSSLATGKIKIPHNKGGE